MADVGRPTKYQHTYPAQVEKLCKLGATDAEIADFFDIDEATVNRWKIDHPEFCESIRAGKTLADANVAHSLYHRATGYEHPDVDIKVIDGEVVITDLVKHYPPDATSMIFWLKNRQKDKWRDKTESDINLTGEIKQITGMKLKPKDGTSL